MKNTLNLEWQVFSNPFIKFGITKQTQFGEWLCFHKYFDTCEEASKMANKLNEKSYA